MHPGPDELAEQGAGDLRATLARLSARRWLIAASIAVCAAGFTAVAFLMTPVYRVDSVLAPANTDRTLGALNDMFGSLGGLSSLAGINIGGADTKTQEALAVLQSRELTQSFIEEKGLLPELFPRDWDARRNAWKTGLRDPPTLAKAYKYFDRKIRFVNLDRKSGLITLSIYWRDRLEAAAWANELVRRLNAEMRARAIAQANDSVADLEKELLVTTTVETRQAISRLIDTQVKQRMMADVTQEYAFRVVDKAIPPDADDPAWPNKLLLLVLGPLAGLALGVFLALALDKLAVGHPGPAASRRPSG